MQAIPYGETRSYGDLAGVTGSAPRAVGRACGKNPIPIVIPCHRVLAKGGLGGYSGEGGLATKQRLLALKARSADRDTKPACRPAPEPDPAVYCLRSDDSSVCGRA